MILKFFKITSILILVAGALIGLGLGIIRLIDYLEENPYGSKDLIQKIIYASVIGHLVFLFMGMRLWQIIFSLSIQYTYHCLFDVYPIVKPEDPRFIYGLVGSLVNYFFMIQFISTSNGHIALIIPYFIIIWTTPIFFFFSMSATEDALFVKKTGKRNKTYAGMALDWALSFGKKLKDSRSQN